jgi:lipopolysaccharide transport system ATP-binding protein
MMNRDDIVIRAEGVSKCYRISHAMTHDTMRDAVRQGTRSLWARLRHRQQPGSSEEFWALRDVGFEIKRGEVIGIIGRNGAGKSTLLKILSRITEPTTGRIELRGRVASLLEVGTGFHPELTGRDNVFLNGAILGMSRAETRRKFDEIVAFAEVEKFLDTPVKHYSSGMYVRLAFAVAAHLEPDILIVDEVLAVGDVAFQKKCLARIQSIVTQEQRTVLLVSHNLNAVLQLCTQVAFLAAGRLMGLGTAAEQVHRYFGSMSPAAAVADLASAKRSGDLRARARFLSARLMAPPERGPWQVPFGDAFVLEICIHTTQRLELLEIGLSLFNMHGLELCSSLSSWSQRLGPIESGHYALEIRYPNLPLVPGSYRFGVGLRSEHDFEDYLPEAFGLDIVESAQSARERFSTIRGALAVDILTTIRPQTQPS